MGKAREFMKSLSSWKKKRKRKSGRVTPLLPRPWVTLLLLCAQVSQRKCWLILPSLSSLQGLTCQWAWPCRQPSKQGGVRSHYISCLNSSLVNTLTCVSFGGRRCKCKRISLDESRPINSYKLAEFLLPAIPANCLKWNTVELHLILCFNPKVNLFLQNRTHLMVCKESWKETTNAGSHFFAWHRVFF